MVAWLDPLMSLAADACEVAECAADPNVVLFYLARWCQKTTGEHEPDVAGLDPDKTAQVAAKIVANLSNDGERVETLVAGDAAAWTRLRRLLCSSAHPRARARTDDCADEALQRIAIVLLTGTPPSLAVARLADGPTGPRNEYVFASPLELWARTVVINLIIDEQRRRAREREAPAVRAPKRTPALDAATLERARDALPELLDAVRALPPVQRSVMVWTLARGDIDEAVLAHLHALAPDLFGESGHGTVFSDAEIAECLVTTPRLVVANRSAARCKLAARDPLWALLLDVLMPHRSPRSAKET